jgi:hypothetical protein
MSSLSFIGDETSYLNIPNTTEFNFGTGDFTIEWYQYQTDTNPYPRIFQVGNFNLETVSIGVSIESGEGDTATFYYWTTGGANGGISLPLESYKNKWVHFAICRISGITNVYMDGTSIFSMEDDSDFNSNENLVIGNEATSQFTETAFGGYLYYFSWVKGTGLYTGNFTVSVAYPTLLEETVLLLKANEFIGTLGESVENFNVTTAPNNAPIPPVIAPPVSRYRWKSTYTDNSLVFYKAGSLAAGGVGSVRNSSIKSRRV